MNIRSPAGNEYQVGKALGKTDRYNLYECQSTGCPLGILKIATTVAHNGALDREAYILDLMRAEATSLEDAYAKIKEGSGMLNYHFLFPNLIESFEDADQGNRRVTILSFSHIVKELGELVPIAFLAQRDRVRVDPKTSAWMMSKLLKLLVFTQSQGISIGAVTGENILIHRAQHYVSVFDWSRAMVAKGNLPNYIVSQEIKDAAREVLLALGGNPETGELPADEQLVDDRYEKALWALVNNRDGVASTVHERFCELIWSVWPRAFHPFTTHRLE